MLAHTYRILPELCGFDHSENEENEKRWISVHGHAKRSRISPNELFNELVAMRLGQTIGIPIPAGMVVDIQGELFFVSCNVMATGDEMPSADFERFVLDDPDMACGVIVFDAWIGNPDRHHKNVWFDYYADPPRTAVIDHGKALLGDIDDTWLDQARNTLTARNDPIGLANQVRSLNHFPKWFDRINGISRSVIREVCDDAKAVGIDTETAIKCANWLINRRKQLPELFRTNLDKFPKLDKSILIDPFGSIDDFPPEYYI